MSFILLSVLIQKLFLSAFCGCELNTVDKLVAGRGAEVIGEKTTELQLVVSASLDCSVCIWSLDSGENAACSN